MTDEEFLKLVFSDFNDLCETQSGKDLIQIGREEGHQKILLCALEAKFGTVEPEIQQRVQHLREIDKLKDLLLQVMKANSTEQLRW